MFLAKCLMIGEKTMGKPKMFGMNKTFIPNSKADQRRNKKFTGAQKKGKEKQWKN